MEKDHDKIKEYFKVNFQFKIKKQGILKEWADELCVNRARISYCCKGKRNHTGGYHFRYATEEEIEEYKNSLK